MCSGPPTAGCAHEAAGAALCGFAAPQPDSRLVMVLLGRPPSSAFFQYGTFARSLRVKVGHALDVGARRRRGSGPGLTVMRRQGARLAQAEPPFAEGGH